MKRLLILLAILPFVTTCTEYAYQHSTSQPRNAAIAAEQAYHCRAQDQQGMTWSRSGATLDDACERALRACRHWRGDLHQMHQPASCVRDYKN